MLDRIRENVPDCLLVGHEPFPTSPCLAMHPSVTTIAASHLLLNPDLDDQYATTDTPDSPV